MRAVTQQGSDIGSNPHHVMDTVARRITFADCVQMNVIVEL